jgi:hypothetical protein
MSRRPLLVLPAVLAAIALPVAPAFAGEDDDDAGSAKLRAPQGCVTGDHTTTAAVTGDDIDSVTFWLDGDRIKTATRPNDAGRYSWTVKCKHLSAGAHRARAVVTFELGSSPGRRTLRFQLTRAQGSGSPRFTG